MRIILVNSARGWAGGPTSGIELGLGLAEKGHDVTLACHPDSAIREQLESDSRLTLAPIGIRAELNPYRAGQLALLNRRVRPELVLADRRKDVKLTVLARLLSRGDFPIVHRHGAPSQLKDSRVYRYTWARQVNAIIVNSHAMRALLLQNAPWLEHVTIYVIHNGKDPSRYRPLPELRGCVRAELGIPEGAFVVSFHGVIQARKHVDALVRAVAALSPKLNVYALIIGRGPAMPELRHLTTELRAPVIFAGLRTDIPEVLSAADAAAHLSTAEGFSNSVLESMACGLPMIVSDATSHPEQVEDGEQGVLVPPGQWEGVADAIRWLAGDPEARAQLGKAARQRVTKEFSRERMLEGYEHALQETVELYRSARRA